jgi:poly(3-hydroxybutyrate) depolymerase
MGRRKSPLVSAFFKMTRAGMRQSTRIGQAAAKQGMKSGGELAEQAGRMLRAVATPTDAPKPITGGRWYDGRWGLGPLAMRRYRLFIPTGGSARKPLPLLLLLHGCAQDTAAFAAVTRAAVTAKSRGFAVLMPEQAQEANPQRCWNWFGSEARVGLETQLLMAIVDHAVAANPRIAGPLFALGLSAGGAMSMTLALRHPERFTAVGSHSGAAPHSASTPLQAGQSMRGRRSPDVDAIAQRLAGRRLPPLVLIHGDLDPVVSFESARAAAGLWVDLLPDGVTPREQEDEVKRGARRAVVRHDWKTGRQPYVRLLRVRGLGHGWSGGASGQAFSDPTGPDALRLAWTFFAATMEQGAAPRL